MISFFTQVIGFLKVVVGLVVNIFSALITLFTEVGRWVVFTTTLFGFLPSVLISFAIFAVYLSLLFLLIGRK